MCVRVYVRADTITCSALERYDPASGKCTACTCDQAGTLSCDTFNGSCSCRANAQGAACDQCIAGHYRQDDQTVDQCASCGCPGDRTTSSVCDQSTSQCHCLPAYAGFRCDSCNLGFYNRSNVCVSCACNALGSVKTACHASTGRCQCKQGYTGEKCDQCVVGFYRLTNGACAGESA